ncbi:MAG: hypothetical protein H6747_05335 [Deltaproteobacteria bacterium]|nr:hypothetical protein [Deltaproteobacteria bacterium]
MTRYGMVRALLLAALLLATPLGQAGCASDDGAAAAGTARASGHGFAFGPGGGNLEGASVHAIDADGVPLPGAATTTAAGGAWALDGLPRGVDLSFVLEKPGFATTQTQVFRLAGDVEKVTFQVPSDAVYDLMSGLVNLEPDPTKCQIATTVTRRGHSLYDGHGTHGEPDATVSISPTVGVADGPVYFNLVKYDVIFPDRELTATSHDGGVLFLDVKPGRYTLIAAKPGATIRPVTLDCRAGVLANASPPWGLQVEAGGLEPKKPGEKGPFD